jgi:small-conductance mechanosensitive channel
LFSAENAGNMLEIAVPADFLWTFSTYFVVFFHTKALMISFLRSFVRSFVRLFIRSLVRSFTRSFAALFRTFISR